MNDEFNLEKDASAKAELAAILNNLRRHPDTDMAFKLYLNDAVNSSLTTKERLDLSRKTMQHIPEGWDFVDYAEARAAANGRDTTITGRKLDFSGNEEVANLSAAMGPLAYPKDFRAVTTPTRYLRGKAIEPGGTVVAPKSNPGIMMHEITHAKRLAEGRVINDANLHLDKGLTNSYIKTMYDRLLPEQYPLGNPDKMKTNVKAIGLGGGASYFPREEVGVNAEAVKTLKTMTDDDTIRQFADTLGTSVLSYSNIGANKQAVKFLRDNEKYFRGRYIKRHGHAPYIKPYENTPKPDLVENYLNRQYSPDMIVDGYASIIDDVKVGIKDAISGLRNKVLKRKERVVE